MQVCHSCQDPLEGKEDQETYRDEGFLFCSELCMINNHYDQKKHIRRAYYAFLEKEKEKAKIAGKKRKRSIEDVFSSE
jgi:hypothetical protein